MAPISLLGDWFKDIAFRHQRANPLQASRREHTIAVMSEEAPNLVLQHLRAIRSELHEIREEQREQRTRLGSIERSISSMTREIAEMGLRLDRIERRLDFVEA
jgi:septal ring factor EnvC (AmiA/AmiB activator)